MNREGMLWIGNLEPYMTEKFLLNAFSLMGEDEVKGIKFIRNKFTGEQATYGFVIFDNDASALMCMHKLNGKMIPNSQPPSRFQLNHTSDQQTGVALSDREYSVWVSDLPSTITEEEFKKLFDTRYNSIKTTKVMKEKDGRTFGFVRFTDLNDQREALIHMNGFNGLGGKPIKVSMAIPKHNLAANIGDNSTQYSHMYESYWSDKSAWGNYGTYQGAYATHQPVLVSSSAGDPLADWDMLELSDEDEAEAEDNPAAFMASAENRLVDYETPVNVDAMNSEYIKRSHEVWDSMEKDRWIYNLENDEGFVPNFSNKKKKKILATFLE